ncbi:MAG: S9 family peptidase, partial [Nocardioidaceae bacterium]|nr:S9 family peptidase [Nocardioidaceae bacterium]
MRSSQMADPPVARQTRHERSHHGDVVVDPYEWLRDKEDATVISHLEAENAYSQALTAHLERLREDIFTEIKSRTLETDLSVPTRKGHWWYYSRTVEGQQYALHCRCPVQDEADWTPPTLDAGVDVPGEQVLLDGNAEADGHEFFALGTFNVSSDGHVLAYSVDTNGAERFTLRFKDLDTGTVLEDEVTNTSYSSAWSLDGSTLFYVTVDEAWRPHRVWRHRLGTVAHDDTVVFEEPDDRFWVSLGITRSQRFVVIEASSKVTSEVHVLDAGAPESPLQVVAPRREGIEYSIEHAVMDGEDRFLILHNDGAENFTLAQAPVDDPSPPRWTTVLEHRTDTRLEGVAAFAGHVAVSLRRDALPRVALLELAAPGPAELREIQFDEELFSCGLGANPEWEQPYLRLGYTSFVTPSTVFDYDVDSGDLLLRKRQPVLGGYEPRDYDQHREWATAPDGTRVPISIVCRAGTDRDGGAPCLLYGYGS